MSGTYIPIERSFRGVGARQRTAWEQRAFRRPSGRDRETWTKLLAVEGGPALVLLAPSGSGKSTETREAARKLRSESRHSVWIEGRRLAKKPLRDSLQTDEKAAFACWENSSDPIVVFVDGVDELYLAGGEWSDLVDDLATVFDPSVRQVRFVISARTGSWSSAHGAALQRLVRPNAPPPLGSHEERDDTSKSAPTRTIVFEPLNQDAIRVLAVAHGVHRIDAFMAAFEAEEFDRHLYLRPTEVQRLAFQWNESQVLGSWAQVSDSLVGASFDDANPLRKDTQTLTRQDGRLGVQRLAAATLLCRKPHIAVPSSGAIAGTISSRRLFDDWTWGKLSELFETSLFEHKGEEAVQLHEGALVDFLAAQWFISRSDNGMPLSALRRALLVRVFDEPSYRVPSSRRSVVGWIASYLPGFRRDLIEINPEIALFEGDPCRLSDLEVEDGLLRVLRTIDDGERAPWPSTATLRKLARPGLEATTCKWLHRPLLSGEAACFLLRLSELGLYRSCAVDAFRLANDAAQTPQVRAAGISLLGKLGSTEHLDKLVDLCDVDDDAIRAELLTALVPARLNGLALRTFLSKGGDYYFCAALATMGSHLSLGDLDSTLDALHSALRQPVHTSLSEKQFDVALPLLCARIARPSDLPANHAKLIALVDALARGGSGPNYHVQEEMALELNRLLAANPQARRATFRARVESPRDATQYWDYLHNIQLGEVKADDLAWLWDQALSASSSEERERLKLLVRRFDRLGDEALRALLNDDGLPSGLSADISAQLEASERGQALEREREQSRREKAAQARKQNELELEPRRAGIENGEDVPALTWAWHKLGAERRNRRLDIGSLQSLAGAELAAAFVTGMKAVWRKQDAPLREPSDNTSEYRCLVGLTGLTLALRDGLDAASFSAPEAKLAAQYALYELNGFPSWFQGLIHAHPDTVRSVLFAQIQAEWVCAAEHYSVLRFASTEPPDTATLLRDVAIELLRESAPKHVATARSAVDAILTSSVDAAEVASLFRREIGEYRVERAAWICEWLRGWAHYEPLAASAWLEMLRARDNVAFLAITCATAALLERDLNRERGANVMARSALMNPLALERWIRLLHLAVRPEDDLQHGNRGYHPRERDHAQDFRRRCMSQLAGNSSVDAHCALRRLMDDASMHPYREDLERARREQAALAAENAVPAWSEDDVLRAERGDEKLPSNLAELFNLVRSHLADVANLVENDDFSYRDLFTGAQEREIQLWVASSLRARARGLYSVVRENTVDDDKEIDISAFAAGVGQVPIEIKPLGPYSLNALRSTLEKQLLGKYMLPPDRQYGVLLLVRHDRKTWKVDGKSVELDAMMREIRSHAVSLGRVKNKVISVESIDLLLAPASLAQRSASVVVSVKRPGRRATKARTVNTKSKASRPRYPR